LIKCAELCCENDSFKVKITSNKRHFYWLLDNFEPVIAVLNVSLCAQDGRVFCRIIRDDAKYARLAIVLFSTASEKLNDYLTYGADSALDKPFNMSDITTSFFAAVKNRSFASVKPILLNQI
jgi:DNA-binding response OmpR family regulator